MKKGLVILILLLLLLGGGFLFLLGQAGPDNAPQGERIESIELPRG